MIAWGYDQVCRSCKGMVPCKLELGLHFELEHEHINLLPPYC